MSRKVMVRTDIRASNRPNHLPITYPHERPDAPRCRTTPLLEIGLEGNLGVRVKRHDFSGI